MTRGWKRYNYTEEAAKLILGGLRINNGYHTMKYGNRWAVEVYQGGSVVFFSIGYPSSKAAQRAGDARL